MGWKQWTRERLTVADLQTLIQDQTVLRFSSVADRTAQLVASKLGMLSYLDDKQTYESRWADGVWRDLQSPSVGKLWRTQGASGALPQNQDTVLQMGPTANRLTGGMTFDGYGGLSVALDGLYDVNACIYWTGSGSWYAAAFLWRGRTGTGDIQIAGSDVHLHAGTIDGRSYVRASQVPLKAGTKLWATAYLYTGGGADAKYRGDSEAPVTTWLSARYLGPLNGVGVL